MYDFATASIILPAVPIRNNFGSRGSTTLQYHRIATSKMIKLPKLVEPKLVVLAWKLYFDVINLM